MSGQKMLGSEIELLQWCLGKIPNTVPGVNEELLEAENGSSQSSLCQGVL